MEFGARAMLSAYKLTLSRNIQQEMVLVAKLETKKSELVLLELISVHVTFLLSLTLQKTGLL